MGKTGEVCIQNTVHIAVITAEPKKGEGPGISDKNNELSLVKVV